MKNLLKIYLISLILVSCSKSKVENTNLANGDKIEQENTSFLISDYPSYPKYYKILEKTTYHGEDMEGIRADKWIGLYKNNNGFYIQNTEVYTRTVHDNILDDEGQNTGKEIVISNNTDNCIVLLGNFDWNCEVPKKVKQIDLTKEFASNESFSFDFLGKNYNYNIKENGYLTISTNINGKIIEQLISTHSCLKRVIFAGDLNSDGKLDLILDTGECDGGATQLTLFMSQHECDCLFVLEALHHSTSC